MTTYVYEPYQEIKNEQSIVIIFDQPVYGCT